MNISVVIPMYNREKTIESTIMSVLKQAVLPTEIIVVDDCSSDGSVEMVKKIRKENRLIRLLRLKENRGAQAARNCGIKVSKGEWILFLDSDDELVYDALAIQRAAVEKNPGYDVYYGDYYAKKYGKKHYVNCRMKGKDGYFLPDILFSSKVFFSGPLIRKTALEDIGLLDERVPSYQEWDTNIRLSVHHRYYYINKPLFIYNLHEGSTISKDAKKSVKGFQYVMRNNGDLFLAEGGMKSIILYYENVYLRYKRCNDFRQYYYSCMAKFFRFMYSHNLMQGMCIKIIGNIWKLEVSLNFDIVSMFRKISGIS